MGFKSAVKLEVIEDGKWKVVQCIVYESEALKTKVSIPQGFETDLASVPRLPFMYMLFGGRATAASIVHDYLYREGVLPRSVADSVFKEAMGDTGVSWVTKWPMYLAVRLAGSFSYKNKHPANR